MLAHCDFKGDTEMRTTVRHLFASALVIGGCALAAPAGAQGNSDKSEMKAEHKMHKAIQKHDQRVDSRRAARRHAAVRRARVLCEDGVWVVRETNACVSRGGLAARQGNYGTTPRASDRARERAAPNSAVRRGTYANRIRRGAIARCSDGTYWHSNTRAGACNRHGGVANWL